MQHIMMITNAFRLGALLGLEITKQNITRCAVDTVTMGHKLAGN